MTETKKHGKTLDRDFVVTPTPQELVGAVTQRIQELEDLSPEQKKLSEQLGAFDFASFALWLEGGERDTENDPAAHAKHLERAAVILHGANNIEAACTMLRRAARLAHDHDQVSESAAVQLLWKYGGEQAVNELRAELKEQAEEPKKNELADVNKRYAAIQRILITFGSHDWEKKLPSLLEDPGLTDAEREELGGLTPETFEPRISALKEDLNALVLRRAELMK